VTILDNFPFSVQPPLSHRSGVLRMPRLVGGVAGDGKASALSSALIAGPEAE
jgi:hypothetical protein